MRHKNTTAAKKVIFALSFVLFFFSLPVWAADTGCHKQNGCGTNASDIFNATPFSEPPFSPAWDDVTKLYRVYGGQYLRFAVQEGQVYRWSTYGNEDIFYSAKYASECNVSDDNACFTACSADVSENCDTNRVLKCLGKTADINHGFCLYPFDTELTLLAGDACSPDSEFLAYSNSDGYYSQSQIEWKATFTGNVVLLVTNYEAQPDGSFASCKKTSGGDDGMVTTVKWQRASSDHCTECGDPVDYALSHDGEASQAPEWNTVRSGEKQQYNLAPTAYDDWIKPGSYIVFDVEEGNIYRWSTCVPYLGIYDTQLSLFKGDAATNKVCTTDPDTGEETCSGDCAKFLAYGDDAPADSAYKKDDSSTFCPVGTKQSILEWHANFSGKVTLLFNEYNCYQCYKRDSSIDSHWAHCYQTTSENGTIYIQPMPLEWQQYDCKIANEGSEISYTAPKYSLGDFCGVGTTCPSQGYSTFANGSKTLAPNQDYIEFSLKRGSKYRFWTNDKSALITIKAKRDGWSSYRTLAQGKGQLSYFANSYVPSNQPANSEPGDYPDIITVMVSKAECRDGDNISLNYAYYDDSASSNADTRFVKTINQDSSSYYTDLVTNTRFVEKEGLVTSWADALNACQSNNGTSGGIFDCPEADCPSLNQCYTNSGQVMNCKDSAVWMDRSSCTLLQCAAPVCPDGTSEYSGRPNDSSDTYYSSLKGVCYLTNTAYDIQNTTYGERKCPAGYTLRSQNGGYVCYNQSGDQYSVYENPTWEKDTAAEITYDQLNITLDEHQCVISPTYPTSGCTRYTTVTNVTNKNSYTLVENTNKCNDKGNALSSERCCCVDSSHPLQKTVLPHDNITPYPYKDSNGVDMTCGNTCPSGYTLHDSSDHPDWFCNKDEGCFKDCPSNYDWIVGKYNYLCVEQCTNGRIQVNDSEEEFWYKCPAGCTNGATLRKVSGVWGCYKQVCAEGYELNSSGKCEKPCPDTGVAITTTSWSSSTTTCYTDVNDDITWRCKYASGGNANSKGYVEVEQGKCREIYRIQKNSYKDQYVACARGTLDHNIKGTNTCNISKPNSNDCDCSVMVAKKQVGATVQKYNCEQQLQAICNDYEYNGHVYHSSEFTLDGGICKFTDITGSECGKPMGGWTLPNINQLYSIVDFDLYNPATSFPLSYYIYGNDDADGDECNPDPEHDDPYGDKQCADNYICENKKCVRNNWYWSSTTVFDKAAGSGEFVWAVNMQDGRSYRAVKGCAANDTACLASSDLNARAHRVICIKGATVAGIFDADAPALEQTFSGWACDKTTDDPVNIYFEITDSSFLHRNVVEFLGTNALITDDLTGYAGKKLIKYGKTDVKPTSTYLTEKWENIYNNCGFNTNPQPHAFSVHWNGTATAGQENLVALIKSIDNTKCTDEQREQYRKYELNEVDTAPDCSIPPYFVTAYAENETTHLASVVSPEKRPFVFHNECKDGYMTYDGTYTENCEQTDIGKKCGYGDTSCKLCAEQNMTVNGENVKACTFYKGNPPACMDGTLQSQFCSEETGYGVVLADDENDPDRVSVGAECMKYDFEAENIFSQNEECDCSESAGFSYYLWDGDDFSCDATKGLTAKICPDYISGVFNPGSPDSYCYICSGCKKEKVIKAHCGDGIVQRADCADNTCQKVVGANEDCDDGNSSNTDDCKNDCTKPKCGDGIIQQNIGEICDSGEKNGYYETDCDDVTVTCPGCASITCGKDGTDPLGPRCGDGIVQNAARCSESSFVTQGKFSSKADCELKLANAHEVCDGGDNNGKEIGFDEFLNQTNPSPETDPAGCYDIIDGIKQPVNSIHAKFAECVYKYNKFIELHSSCSSDCTQAVSPYCGDGVVSVGETCDEGLPKVVKSGDQYYIAEAENYNGKGYGHCKFDCLARYRCGDNIKEKEDCGSSCSTIGGVSDGEVYLYVNGGREFCDMGIANGAYGSCADNCMDYARCGNGNKKSPLEQGDCISSDDSGNCIEYEECDFGLDQNGNKPISEAYSKAQFGSCISESNECKLNPAQRSDSGMICCKYGRYCGDGIVDNGEGVGIENSSEWFDSAKWTASNMTVGVDNREQVLTFTLNGLSATAELDIALPVAADLRYFIEYDMKIYSGNANNVKVYAGVNHYSDEEGTTKLTVSECANNSPYYFADNGLVIYSENGHWYHSKNASPVQNFGCGALSWLSNTKTVKITFKITGDTSTVLHLRGLKFYAMEELQEAGLPRSGGGGAREMCDNAGNNIPESQAASDNTYMVTCTDGCKWTNYCGDGEIFDGHEVCDNGTNASNVYNGCEPGCIKRGPHCGDGIINRFSCSNYNEGDCVVPATGLVENEECDDPLGNSNDPLAAGAERVCRENCKYSTCGDGILDYGEECDCGVEGLYAEGEWPDTISQYAVDAMELDSFGHRVPIKDKNDKYIFPCTFKNDAGEDIRDYNTYSATRSGSCRPDCKLSTCGDGIKGPGEKCDDGNMNNDDSCLNNCQQLDTCGDGYFSSKRSYLCEELLGTITHSALDEVWEGNGIGENLMIKMAARGVVDCGDDKMFTCGYLAGELKSGTEIYKYLTEYGVLHCCFNQKLIGGKDDNNCEIELSNGSWQTPKNRAIARCMTTKKLDNVDYDEAMTRSANECANEGFDDHLERCDFAASVSEEDCRTKYQGDKNKANRERCIEQISTYHTYCEREHCYNVTGGCGDGERNYITGPNGQPIYLEACDSRVSTDPQAGFYYDIDGWKRAGKSGGDGLYCTGNCRGNCTNDGATQKRRCQSASDNDCWEYNKKDSAAEYWATIGCTNHQHNGSENSKCGDNSIDTFAGEICDDGNTLEGDYCAGDCKGVTGSCGDGIKQDDRVEVCDTSSTCDDNATVNGAANDCTKVKGEYCKEGCGVDYGKCGDNKITGPGFNWYDGHTASDSKISLTAPNTVEGPEHFDTTDARTKTLTDTLSSDADKKTFIKTFAKTDSAGNIECKRKDTCGDGTRNFRLEGCDCGNGNGNSSGTCDISSYSGNLTISTTCYNDCYSAAIGQVDVAGITPKMIRGWVCDPDHPMLDGDPSDNANMIKIKFKNKNGAYDSHTLEVKTGEQIPDSFNEKDVITICGGGKLHGWKADPSSAGIDPKGSPYTIEVYALSRDTGEKTEVLIGEKPNFITQMQCGDEVITKCSELYVTQNDANHTQLQLYNNWKCVDGEVQGGCSYYGFVNGEICRDEACEKGMDGVVFGRNGDCFDKDYTDDMAGDDSLQGRKCQWTWCGDGIIQATSTDTRKHEGAHGMGGEECEKPGTDLGEDAKVDCKTLGLQLPTGTEATDSDSIWGTTQTCGNSCKYDRTAGCKLTSKCPSLKEVVTKWQSDNPNDAVLEAYDDDKFAQYIAYHNETYTRDWVCDAGGCHWSGKVSAVYSTSENADDHKCEYYCKNTLYWNGKYCAPRSKDDTSQRIKTKCEACTDPYNGDSNGKWTTGGGDCFDDEKTAYIGTTVEDGDVKYVVPQPDGITKTEAVGLNVPQLKAQYEDDSSWQCNWKCADNSTYSSQQNKCYVNDKTYNCTDKPNGSRWVKITGATSAGVSTEILAANVTTLEVQQIRTGFDGSGNAIYSPNENEKFTGAGLTNIKKLQAMYINADSGLSAYSQRSEIAGYFTTGSTNANPRCFWVCDVGKVAEKGNQPGVYSCKTPMQPEEKRCPAGLTNDEKTKIYNEDCSKVKESARCEVRVGYHQKCNDSEVDDNNILSTYNGLYGSWEVNGQTVSHCKANCGEKKSGDEWVEEDTNDHWGRIKYKDDPDGTLKLYCGDDVTQSTSDVTGLPANSWRLSNSTNYPGAMVFKDELCDGTPDTNARQQLCDRYLSKYGATTATSVNKTYHENSSISCNGTCDGMTNISGTTATAINYTWTTYPCGFCGDGRINFTKGDNSTQEKCDDGADNGKYGKCNTSCDGYAPRCGDGTIQNADCSGIANCTTMTGANEKCDWGSDNTSSYTCPYGTSSCTYCNTSCENKDASGPYCGDGIVQSANSEICDTGISYSCWVDASWTEGSGCSASNKTGYDVYAVSCNAGCKGRTKGSTCESHTSSQTCSGKTNLGKCGDIGL